mmetsp:Transcript_7751/g.25740  ORF Transcript_7751/g.25740 Transcript_7751/m.25740 type:complete len:204 (-) Transcript_7751:384-995(-)
MTLAQASVKEDKPTDRCRRVATAASSERWRRAPDGPRPAICVERRVRLLGKATRTDGTARDMQKVMHKRHCMLIPRLWHRPRSGHPLPTPVAVSHQRVHVCKRHITRPAPRAEQQHAVIARSGCGIHPRWRHWTRSLDSQPSIRLDSRIERPHLLRKSRTVVDSLVPAYANQVTLRRQSQGVRVARPWSFPLCWHLVPARWRG